MKGEKHLILVYGTLKEGERNNHQLPQNSEFMGEDTTLSAQFEIVVRPSKSSPGRITPAVQKGGRGYIHGEIYQIDQAGLDHLDEFEENGVHYLREEVELKSGKTAWIYCAIQDVPEQTRLKNQNGITLQNKVYSWSEAEIPTYGLAG